VFHVGLLKKFVGTPPSATTGKLIGRQIGIQGKLIGMQGKRESS
jgi:hypothetical protein